MPQQPHHLVTGDEAGHRLTASKHGPGDVESGHERQAPPRGRGQFASSKTKISAVHAARGHLDQDPLPCGSRGLGHLVETQHSRGPVGVKTYGAHGSAAARVSATEQ